MVIQFTPSKKKCLSLLLHQIPHKFVITQDTTQHHFNVIYSQRELSIQLHLQPNMYNTQDHIHNRTQMIGEIGRTHSKQKKADKLFLSYIEHMNTPGMEQALLQCQANCSRGESTCMPTCKMNTPRLILSWVLWELECTL